MEMSLYNILLTVILVVDCIFIIAVIFLERKNPASTMAWVLVFMFLPGIGALIYLLVGSGFKVNKQKRYAMKSITDAVSDNLVCGYLNLNDIIKFYENNHDYTRIAACLRSDGSIYTLYNQAEIFTDGNSMFERMLDDMRQASSHIHLLYYIFRNDNLGKRIISLLEEKARSGVEVRVLYDSFGSMLGFSTMFKKLIQAGGKVYAFEPLLLHLSPYFRLNYRNHRKITVVDGKIAYVGGMNIGDEYMGQDKKLKPWRDTGLRITGQAAWFLQSRFLLDFSYSSDEKDPFQRLNKFFPDPDPRQAGALGIQIASSGPDQASEKPIKSGMLEMLYSARRNIYIQTPYFTPDESFLEAIRIAIRSGVDVRLMVPGVSDNPLAQNATLSYCRDVFKMGCKVYLYNGFLHAKAVVIDGAVASIGSTNIGTRSFALNFEVNAFVYDNAFASQYEDIFHEDAASSLKLDQTWFDERNLPTRLAYSIARLFSPLM